MYISQIIDLGSKALKEKKIKSHILDSELILSEILRISREKILVSSDIFVSIILNQAGIELNIELFNSSNSLVFLGRAQAPPERLGLHQNGCGLKQHENLWRCVLETPGLAKATPSRVGG